MSEYRPGQLYTGAEGDLLFTILGTDGISFVTNRGTAVSLEQAERVYAPLTLVPTASTTPALSAVDAIVAIHDGLAVPRPATGAAVSWQDVVTRRALHVVGALQAVASRPDLWGTDTLVRSALEQAVQAAETHPVNYLTREQEEAADAEPLVPPSIGCRHCGSAIAWEYGDWAHLDNEHRECDPDDWGGEFAEPGDDPAEREFAKALVGRRVAVALHGGSHLVGVLVASADWTITVEVDGADGRREVLRPRRIRHVQPLATQAEGDR